MKDEKDVEDIVEEMEEVQDRLEEILEGENLKTSGPEGKEQE